MSRFSQIKALAFQIAPKAVQRRLLKYAENKRLAYWKECFKTKVSKEEVDALFSCMALDSDTMIHSSLPEIGDIKRQYVTENLKKYLLDQGKTILCPAIPVKGSTLDYLKSIKEFDVRSAPNAMGTLSRYFGRQNGAKRSLSPTHSVIAVGNRTEYYTKDHHRSETPFTENSPYFKLLPNGGKILMFGAALSHLTFTHVLQDLIGEKDYPAPLYDPRRFEVELIDEEGLRAKGTFRAHSHKCGRQRDSSEIMGIIRNLPSTKVYRLGCGEVILLDARDVMRCLLTQLKSGVTTMGHRKVSEACKKKADEWIDYLNRL